MIEKLCSIPVENAIYNTGCPWFLLCSPFRPDSLIGKGIHRYVLLYLQEWLWWDSSRREWDSEQASSRSWGHHLAWTRGTWGCSCTERRWRCWVRRRSAIVPKRWEFSMPWPCCTFRLQDWNNVMNSLKSLTTSLSTRLYWGDIIGWWDFLKFTEHLKDGS